MRLTVDAFLRLPEFALLLLTLCRALPPSASSSSSSCVALSSECAITLLPHHRILAPVLASDGRVYDAFALRRWLRSRPASAAHRHVIPGCPIWYVDTLSLSAFALLLLRRAMAFASSLLRLPSLVPPASRRAASGRAPSARAAPPPPPPPPLSPLLLFHRSHPRASGGARGRECRRRGTAPHPRRDAAWRSACRAPPRGTRESTTAYPHRRHHQPHVAEHRREDARHRRDDDHPSHRDGGEVARRHPPAFLRRRAVHPLTPPSVGPPRPPASPNLTPPRPRPPPASSSPCTPAPDPAPAGGAG